MRRGVCGTRAPRGRVLLQARYRALVLQAVRPAHPGPAPAQLGRLQAPRSPASERAALDARAQPVPAWDDRLGGLQAGRGPLPAGPSVCGRDEIHAPEDAALLAGRDLLVLTSPAPARDAAGIPRVHARVNRDP